MIFIVDKNEPYLILFNNNKKSGGCLMEFRGKCRDGNIEANAIKKTFNQSCGVFMIKQSALVESNSVMVDRFKIYLLVLNMTH